MPQNIYTKDALISRLKEIKNAGWIKIGRNANNHGVIGNTLEDLLGIEENNLPIPNAAEWELKTRRKNTSSLLTLFHMEPSPRALKLVNYLLNNFGWQYEKDANNYKENKKSFRQTLSYHSPTIRGFELDINENEKKLIVKFDYDKIPPSLSAWKEDLKNNNAIFLPAEYTPYWGFTDLFHKAGSKLKNCFFVEALEKRDKKDYYVKYETIYMLSNLQFDRFMQAIKDRKIYVDFDARSDHNHGTKFRIKPDAIPALYENSRIF